MSTEDSSMMTVKEVAERLQVSSGLIYKLIQKGDLLCYRIGSAIRFSEDHLAEYLNREPPSYETFKHLRV